VSKVNEFQRGWKILILAFLGVATSAAVMPLYGFGVLMAPLQEAFGWSRSDLMATNSFSAFGAIFSAQIAGWLNKRYGLRPIALLSFIGLFLAFLIISQLDKLSRSIWLLYGFFGLLSFAGIGTLQVTWTDLVNRWFEKNRGLALAIILSGSGFMGVLLPPLITTVIEYWSWRAGFVLLAVFPLLITLPLAWFWLQPMPGSQLNTRRLKPGQAEGSVLPGVSFSEGIRSWKYWVINFSMVMVAGAIMVMVINTVPMLQDKGYTALEASKLFAVFGLSLVSGRVAVGFLVDRLWAPGVAFVVLLMSAVGCFLLATIDNNTQVLILSIGLIGVGAGAEFDLAAFLIARYFGMRDYGRLFGLQMGVISAGICLAPAAVAYLYHQTGSYSIVLSANVVLLAAGASILLLLGRYPLLTSTAEH
jgi:MFS family permease